MNLPNTGSFLSTLARPERVGVLTDRVKNLPVAEFVCLLDFITAEFQQSLNAFDLLNNAALESILEQILEAIAFKVGQILQAEYTTVFLVDRDRSQVWARPDGLKGREIRAELGKGLTGRSAYTGETINADLTRNRAGFEPEIDARPAVTTKHLLCMPVRSSGGDVVAVVQLLNKRHEPSPAPAPIGPPTATFSPEPAQDPVTHRNGQTRPHQEQQAQVLNRSAPPESIADSGPDQPDEPFSQADETRFREFAAAIGIILESCQSFYAAARNQRGVAALLEVMNCFARTTDLDSALDAVMAQTRDLLQAEQANLFLIDRSTGKLRTRAIEQGGKTIDLPLNRGIVGYVAQTGQPVNVGHAVTDPRFDPTIDGLGIVEVRNILCLPLFDPAGQLIGVSQAVNRQQGSFTASDEAFLAAFNTQAGIALENARLFESVSLERQYQKDILRSLSNAVISTDLTGQIVTINEAALDLLGCPPEPHARDHWEQALRRRFVWDIVPADSLRTRLDDSLRLGARHYVPDQAFTVLRLQTGVGWAQVQVQDDKVYLWNDRQQVVPLDPAQPPEAIERVANLSVTPLTNPDGQVRGGLVVLEDVSREKRMKSALYRYMNPAVADLALATAESTFEQGQRRDVTILFSDIRGYTTLSESLDAAEVVALLNGYFETMVEAVFGWGGTLDKFIGDALMAVFGAPLDLPDDHGWTGVRTALEMRDRLQVFNQHLAAQGSPILRAGIGLCSGEVIVGNIGSQRRMDYTAIGDPVNVSARLEDLTKQYGCDIILSESTYQRCQEFVWVRELDRVRVKGKRQSLRIYELISDRSRPLPQDWQAFMEVYDLGLEAYHRFRFQQALVHFSAAQRLRPHDRAVKLHIDRSTQYLDCPPPEYWDGAFAAPGTEA